MRLSDSMRDEADGRKGRGDASGAAAMASAASIVDAACTPRPLQPEWFGDPFDAEGKSTGKWDSWWVRWIDGTTDVHQHLPTAEGEMMAVIGWGKWDITECVPVAREGFPAPVGWGVVGG